MQTNSDSTVVRHWTALKSGCLSILGRMKVALTRDVLDYAIEDLIVEEWIALVEGDDDKVRQMQKERGLCTQVRILWP